MSENKGVAKKIILEFIEYLRYKVENDRLMMEDMEGIVRALENGLELRGTAEDFAKFYGKSVDSVRHVLHRKVLDTPKREVLHSFGKFRKDVPDSWRK